LSSAETYRLAVGPTYPPVQGIVGALPLGIKLLGYEVTTYLYLAPRLRMSGAMPLLLYTFIACTGTTLPFIYKYVQ
jgi:hypothetical protein